MSFVVIIMQNHYLETTPLTGAKENQYLSQHEGIQKIIMCKNQKDTKSLCFKLDIKLIKNRD